MPPSLIDYYELRDHLVCNLALPPGDADEWIDSVMDTVAEFLRYAGVMMLL